jgi:2-aminoadipate transaminase
MNIDKSSTTPLYMQIRDDLRQSILTGALKPGDRLPSVTALAEEKRVTAATIRRALQDLMVEGFVSSHVGRGTFVTDPTASASAPEGRILRPESRIASRALRQSVSKNLSELMNLANKPGVIGFTRGIGSPDTIEKGILTRLAKKALAGGEELFHDYGDYRGLPSLRAAIAALYAEQGIDVAIDQILVTSGSQQAVALLAQMAAENDTEVVCETPCYAGVTNAFFSYGLDVHAVPRAEDGPDLSRLSPAVDPRGAFFYLCPILHNPTGTDIGAARQAEVAKWAVDNDALLIADEVFRDLHFDGDGIAGNAAAHRAAPESFLKNPGPDRAVILGSLSKSFISGLRVGWIVTSEERVTRLAQIKKATDLGCPPLMQGIAQAFLEDPEGYRAHRLRVRDHYRALRDETLASLGRFMPDGVSWTRPAGGFQLQVTLPAGASSVELFLRAVEAGVAFLPGPLQDIDNRHANTFRLCYGSLSADDIREGIKRLGAATREYLGNATARAGCAGLGDY